MTAKGRVGDVTTRERLTESANILRIQIKEQQRVLEQLQAMPVDIGTVQHKFLENLAVQIGLKEIEADFKEQFVSELKSLPKTEFYIAYRVARDRLRTKLLNYKAQQIAARPVLTNEDIVVDEEPLGAIDVKTDKHTTGTAEAVEQGQEQEAAGS